MRTFVEPCRFVRGTGRDPTAIPGTVRRGRSGRENVRELSNRLCAGKEVDPPFVAVKTGPCEQGRLDGSHRLISACRVGISSVPLEVLFQRDRNTPFFHVPPDEARSLFARCLR